MMLIIQDRNPIVSAQLVPDKLKFKQLLELCQLICSAGICDIYKPVSQGKELQEWIKKNQYWTFLYGGELFNWCRCNINLKDKTVKCFRDILWHLLKNKNTKIELDVKVTTAIFRYNNQYKSKYESNSELPIGLASYEYEKYIKWKMR